MVSVQLLSLKKELMQNIYKKQWATLELLQNAPEEVRNLLTERDASYIFIGLQGAIMNKYDRPYMDLSCLKYIGKNLLHSKSFVESLVSQACENAVKVEELWGCNGYVTKVLPIKGYELVPQELRNDEKISSIFNKYQEKFEYYNNPENVKPFNSKKTDEGLGK